MLDDLGVALSGTDPREEDHVDIRIEALMPKVSSFEAGQGQRLRS